MQSRSRSPHIVQPPGYYSNTVPIYTSLKNQNDLNMANNRNYPSLQKTGFQQNSSVNLLMELNQMKKDLRSTANPVSYQRPLNSPREMMGNTRDNFSSMNQTGMSKNDYLLGNLNTRDLVNESRNDFQLPVQSQNVDITRISYNQFNNPNSGYNNYVPPSKPEMNRYSEPQNFNRNTNQSFHNTQNNYEMKNSFAQTYNRESSPANQNFKYNQRGNSHDHNNLLSTRARETSRGNNRYGRDNNNSVLNNNSMMNTFDRSQQPNTNNMVNQAEIEKNQLNEFYIFLKEKERTLETKINSMPKHCRRVSDKREKMELEKQLDEVVQEINYVQGMLNKP